MADEADNQTETQNELQLLKERARLMNITFSNNIGLDALKAKIAAKLDGEAPQDEVTDDNDQDDQVIEPETAPEPEVVAPIATVTPAAPQPAVTQTAPTPPAPEPAPAPKPEKVVLTKAQQIQKMREELLATEMALVRVRITNLNPSKKDLPGEIITCANEYIGSVRKFVPYGELTDDGFHVPMCLYRQMDERRFQHIRTVKDRRTGINQVKTSWAREFALEILPPLTEEELKQLAMAQAAAGSVPGLED